MARLTNPLSDTQIRKAKPNLKKSYQLTDSNTPFISIEPSGSKL